MFNMHCVFVILSSLAFAWKFECISFVQGDVCAASNDSIFKTEEYGMPILCSGFGLLSSPTAQYTMDYSTARIDEDEVNSPPRRRIQTAILSPSPLRPRRIMGSPRCDNGRAMKGKRVLYDGEVPQEFARSNKVC